MATHPYLYRRTSGTYYLRITVPKHVLVMNPDSSRDIRLSLHTPYKAEATQLACYLRYCFHQYLDSFKNQRFTLSSTSFSRYITLQLKEIITQHYRDTEIMSEEAFEHPYVILRRPKSPSHESPSESEFPQEQPTLTTFIEKRSINIHPQSLIEIEGNGVRAKFDYPDDPAREEQLADQFLEKLMGGNGGNGGGNSSPRTYPVEFVFEEYIKNKVNTNLKANPDTKKENIQMLDVLVKLLGPKTNFATLTYDDGEELCADILKLKDSRVKDQTKAKTISPGRAKKFLGKFKSVAKYAKKKGFNAENIGEDLEIIFTKPSKDNSDKVFNPESLVALFSGYPYTQVPLAKERDIWDFHFWAIPIYTYTGARLNEICQLRVEDIKSTLPRKRKGMSETPERIHYFDIKKAFDDNGVQTHFIKNQPSIRSTPIHKDLIALGFLDFVEERRKEAGSSAMLFDGLNFDSKNKYGKKFGDWFHGGGKMKSYRDVCGIKQKPKPNVHSFRHTFINEYRNTPKIDRTVLAAIVGHDTDLQTDEYGGDTALHVLKAEMDKVEFDLDLSHLDYQKFKEYRGRRGK